MNNNQKNIGLLLGFILALIFSYSFAIKKTFEAKNELVNLEKDKNLLSTAAEKVFALRQENNYLDTILKQRDLSIENSFQQTLFKKVSNFCKVHKAEIISFDEPHSFLEQETFTLTYSFEIKANFNSLLKFTNYLEREQLGTLISVRYQKKRNYKRNKEELLGKFYVEKLTQTQANK